MKTLRLLRPAIVISVMLCLAGAPAFAACPSLPDGPDSKNVENGQQRALCLQQELHDSTTIRNTQTQINNLQSSFDQMQIQRRFDNLPEIAPYRP